MSEAEQKTRPVEMVAIGPGEAGQRIDNFLLTRLKGVPRSYIYRILRKGEVRVNKGRIKAEYRLQGGDQVRIPPLRMSEEKAPPRPGAGVLEQLRDALIHEDERILVINKPAGLAVHGGSGLSYGVIEALRVMRPEQRYLELVHRLDRETSGLLLLAKKRSALRQLHELLREGQVDKRYWALLDGQLEGKVVEVDAPLRKNTLRGGERLVSVEEDGKQARSRFRLIRRVADASLVEVMLLTGRTHQIRVHSAHMGHPILGDTKYGNDEANARWKSRGLARMFLHARSMSFRWPGEDERIALEAPLPSELDKLLEFK